MRCAGRRARARTAPGNLRAAAVFYNVETDLRAFQEPRLSFGRMSEDHLRIYYVQLALAQTRFASMQPATVATAASAAERRRGDRELRAGAEVLSHPTVRAACLGDDQEPVPAVLGLLSERQFRDGQERRERTANFSRELQRAPSRSTKIISATARSATPKCATPSPTADSGAAVTRRVCPSRLARRREKGRKPSSH